MDEGHSPQLFLAPGRCKREGGLPCSFVPVMRPGISSRKKKKQGRRGFFGMWAVPEKRFFRVRSRPRRIRAWRGFSSCMGTRKKKTWGGFPITCGFNPTPRNISRVLLSLWCRIRASMNNYCGASTGSLRAREHPGTKGVPMSTTVQCQKHNRWGGRCPLGPLMGSFSSVSVAGFGLCPRIELQFHGMYSPFWPNQTLRAGAPRAAALNSRAPVKKKKKKAPGGEKSFFFSALSEHSWCDSGSAPRGGDFFFVFFFFFFFVFCFKLAPTVFFWGGGGGGNSKRLGADSSDGLRTTHSFFCRGTANFGGRCEEIEGRDLHCLRAKSPKQQAPSLRQEVQAARLQLFLFFFFSSSGLDPGKSAAPDEACDHRALW